VTDVQALWHNITTGTFDILTILTFWQETSVTFYKIAEDCQFISLWRNILKWGNPITIITKVIQLLVFKVPALLKADWAFIKAVFHWQAYGMGFGTGKITSIMFDWQIY
jgi:hypothetical protein